MFKKFSQRLYRNPWPTFQSMWKKSRFFNHTSSSLLSTASSLPTNLPLNVVQKRLTYPQLQMFLCHQKYPGSVINHHTYSFQLKNNEQVFDYKKLENAILSAALSFDTLRTSFHEEQSNYIQSRFDVDRLAFPIDDMVTYFDFSMTSSVVRKIEVNRLIDEVKKTHIDITKWPLVQFTCIKEAYDTYTLLVHAHHIILDGLGMAALLNKIADYYNTDEQIIKPQLDHAYEKYCTQYNYEHYIYSGDTDASKHWQNRLNHSHFLFDVVNDNIMEPFSRPVKGVHDTMDASHILKTVKQQNMTLFEFMSAAYTALLGQYTGQSDICVGYPATLRNHSSRNLVAHALNNLPLRVLFSNHWTFAELAQSIRTIRKEDKPYIRYPAEMINRIGDQTSVFYNTSIISVVLGVPFPLSGLEVISHNLVSGILEELDILNLFFDLNEDQSLTLSVLYQPDLLNREFALRFLDNVKNFLTIVSQNPDIVLLDIPFMAPKERHTLLDDFSGIHNTLPKQEKTVYDHFYESVITRPNQPVLIDNNTVLTYQELSDKIDAYSIKLKQMNVTQGDSVILATERSVERIAMMLAIMKIRAVLVPIEADESQRKKQLITEDIKPKLMITGEQYTPFVESETLPQPTDEISHIMYTSGTTGTPKGIMIGRQAFSDRIGELSHAYQITAQDIVLHSSSLSFDTSFEEIFVALRQGAVLAVAPVNAHQDMRLLVAYIDDKQVTVLDMVPSLLQTLTEYMLASNMTLPLVTCVISGGEELSNRLAKQIYQCFPNSRLLNTYGPSEVNIVCTYTDVKKDSIAPIPIGLPLPNTTVYVLSEDNKLVPWGSRGQLCVGGSSISSGYVHQPLLTQEKFIKNPFGEGYLYKTGDIVKFDEQGQLKFYGRSDHQYKVHGRRIELGEINAILESSLLLSQCVTVMKKAGQFKDKFVVYITFNQVGKTETLIRQLDDFSKKALSSIRIGGYVVLDAFPKLTSGKIDVNQLAYRDDTEQVHTIKRNRTTPQDERMQALMLAIADVLNVSENEIDIEASFHDLGGDSFDAIKLRSQLDIQFNISPPIPMVLNNKISALYQLVKQQKEGTPYSPRLGFFKVRDGTFKEEAYTLFLHSGYGMINKEMQLTTCLTGLICAIDNPYFGEEITPFNSIRDMGAHYHSLIQHENLSSPDRIVGWSLGGILAIELAEMIYQQKGYKPDIILLDSYNWAMINQFYQENGLTNPLVNTHNMDYLIRQSGNIDPTLSYQLGNELQNSLALLANYTPIFYGGRVILLQATDLSQDMMQLDPELRQWLAEDNGWKGVVNPDQFHVLSVSGNHYTLLNEEYIASTQNVFKTALTLGSSPSPRTPFTSSIFPQQSSNKYDNDCPHTPTKGPPG